MRPRLFSALPAALTFLMLTSTVPVRGEVTLSTPISRAQAISSIFLSRGSKLPAYDPHRTFADIPAGSWFEAPMRAAEQYGIIQGDEAGRLRPHEPVTRADFLKMITLAFGLPQNLSFQYTDVPRSEWYARYAGIAERYGLFRKNDDATLLSPYATLNQTDVTETIAIVLRHQATTKTGVQIRKIPLAPASKPENPPQGETSSPITSTRRVRVAPTQPVTSVRRVRTTPLREKTLHELRADMLSRINAIRTEHGLRPLKYNVLLEGSAQLYAEDMSVRGFFSHVSPDGQTLKDRALKGGYRDRSFSADCFCVKGYALGENLAHGQRTPAEAVDAWMRSPPHRSAILSPEYKDVGFGYAGSYWVQHFGAIIMPTDIIINGIKEPAR